MKVRCAILAAVAGVAVASSAQAAVSFTGNYSQNFDSIGPTGTAAPTDWVAGNVTANRSVDGGGVLTSQALVPDDGTNGVAANTQGTIGKNYNYGSLAAPSDRAIGSVPTTASFDRALQVALTNNTGGSISSLKIGYTGEQWRYGQGDSALAAENQGENLRVFYSTSVSSGWTSIGLNFGAPKLFDADRPGITDQTQLDGNAPANRTVLSTNFVLPSPLADGSSFYIRWLDWNENSTSDHGLAVDDVSVSVVPEPASLSLLSLAVLPLLRRRRD